jgi:hypothetical protein
MDKSNIAQTEIPNQDSDQEISELGELQLSLVGGGSGDVVFH